MGLQELGPLTTGTGLKSIFSFKLLVKLARSEHRLDLALITIIIFFLCPGAPYTWPSDPTSLELNTGYLPCLLILIGHDQFNF